MRALRHEFVMLSTGCAAGHVQEPADVPAAQGCAVLSICDKPWGQIAGLAAASVRHLVEANAVCMRGASQAQWTRRPKDMGGMAGVTEWHMNGTDSAVPAAPAAACAAACSSP